MAGGYKDAIQTKVKKLLTEGKDSKQAYATAKSMERKDKLGPKGGYKK